MANYLNSEAALKYAMKLTVTAMEHSMISISSDPSETADNVTKFFNTVADTLTGNKEN